MAVCPRGWGLRERGVTLIPSPPAPAPSFRFPSDLLLTSSTGELWRMVRIGGQPLGFGERGRGGRVPPPRAQHHPSSLCLGVMLSRRVPMAAPPGPPLTPASLALPRRVWHRGPDRRAAGRRRHIGVLHQHLQLRSCLGEPLPSPGTRRAGGVPGADTLSVSPPSRQVPEEGIAEVIQLLQQRQESGR